MTQTPASLPSVTFSHDQADAFDRIAEALREDGVDLTDGFNFYELQQAHVALTVNPYCNELQFLENVLSYGTKKQLVIAIPQKKR